MKVKFVAKKEKKGTRLRSLFSIRELIHHAGVDEGLLFCVLGLMIFGWVMVYSSSALYAETHYHDQYYFLKRQVLWSLIGLAFFMVAANIPFKFWQKNCHIIFLVTVVALVLVLGIGPKISGARRWIRIGGFNFQPSELAKLSIILLAADYLDRRQSRLKNFKKGLLPILSMVGLVLALILKEPDLGTPVLMGAVFLALLILGGARWKHLTLMAVSAVPLIALAIFQVRYRLARLLAYLNPWSDAQGAGYQLVQSLMAMGSGGLFGRGLGESKIKIAHLPDAHTDFIFSVLGEELGLLGTLSCVALFFFLCFRGLRIARKAPTCFSMLVAAGISLTIGLQAVINMGVACGMFPTKGMPLPFVSFGGSSLVVMMLSVGILANVSRQPAAPLAKAK
jgi:cell division protein FtsW